MIWHPHYRQHIVITFSVIPFSSRHHPYFPHFSLIHFSSIFPPSSTFHKIWISNLLTHQIINFDQISHCAKSHFILSKIPYYPLSSWPYSGPSIRIMSNGLRIMDSISYIGWCSISNLKSYSFLFHSIRLFSFPLCLSVYNLQFKSVWVLMTHWPTIIVI